MPKLDAKTPLGTVLRILRSLCNLTTVVRMEAAMDDRTVLYMVITFGIIWVACWMTEVAFKLWRMTRGRETIGERWIREDREASKDE